MVEHDLVSVEATAVPGPRPDRLMPAERRRLLRAAAALDRARRRLEAAERAFAAEVRSLGVSACARELGVSRQALRQRVVRIERRGPNVVQTSCKHPSEPSETVRHA
ncbi:MAG TPA: hypothetical protein VNO79_10975 [Actinomycetota bacterium]|nr:hypothetical protein [Actinomycetota bacterium]